MSRNYDNWERLVEAVLDREKLREIARAPSLDSSFNSIISDVSFDYSLENVPASGILSSPSILGSPTYNGESSVEDIPDFEPIAFEELKLATHDFRLVLGEGRFSSVSYGWIEMKSLTGVKPGSGMAVAVKKWNINSLQCRTEWVTQFHYLRLMDHQNLVKFITGCFDENNLVLVYEYMPNGSLENLLFRGERSFSWETRINVAIDVARGLTFLHNRTIQVIHQNVKASNILLDGRFNAKLSGFSLARYSKAFDMNYICTQFGTYNFYDGFRSDKWDVNDFGVVLLELLSGRPAVDKTKVHEEQNLVDWAKSYMGDKTKLLRIIDRKLKGHYPQKKAYIAAILAFKCVNPKPNLRPSMIEREVNYLGQFHHPNLVKIIGYCSEGDNRLLVYEFMAKRDLDMYLFPSKDSLTYFSSDCFVNICEEWEHPFSQIKKWLYRIMDPKLENVYPKEGAYGVATLALNCLSSTPERRLCMMEVLAPLQQIKLSSKN